MKILIAIVHYWNPHGGGRHQSLRPDPTPRIQALQEQLLSLRRLGHFQSLLHMSDRAVYRTNDFYRHSIDIRIITDGSHHVLDNLHPSFSNTYEPVVTKPSSGLYLGFEAQKYLASQLDSSYDFYGYMEDDLIIHDSAFFAKIKWFCDIMGNDSLLLPQRVEFSSLPHAVDRFYIDGPIPVRDLSQIIPKPGPVRLVEWANQSIPFSSPLNPHAGCFFLNHCQLVKWSNSEHWQDLDTSFISPLESAATLGISKDFDLLKPCFSHAGWLEIQHFGNFFHELLDSMVSK